MKMLDTRLVSLTSKSILKLLPKFMSKYVQGKKLLFSLFMLPFLCLPVSPSQGGEELVAKPQSVNKFFYPSYSVNTLLEQAKTRSGKPSNINWLLNNSVVEDGIYSLEFKSGKKGQYGGKPKGNGIWENLSLKFSLDLLPKQYYHTSLPWLSENDLFNKDTRTHFRANRSRVVFSISGEWY